MAGGHTGPPLRRRGQAPALHDKAKRRVCPYNLPAQGAFVARFHTFNGKTRAFFCPEAKKQADITSACCLALFCYRPAQPCLSSPQPPLWQWCSSPSWWLHTVSGSYSSRPASRSAAAWSASPVTPG